MKVIADDISKLKRLDKKYDKLTDAADADKKKSIGDKIAKLRGNIAEEIGKRKERLQNREANHADHPKHHKNKDNNSTDATPAATTTDTTSSRWSERMDHLDERLKEVDDLIDPSLISHGETSATL